MQFQLLILESIGTQELILVGLVALIVFGPRKLPEMARKFGKMMTELRKVSSDFRSTWEREASMVENAFKMDEKDEREPRSIGSSASEADAAPRPAVDTGEKGLPTVKELSTEDFRKFAGTSKSDPAGSEEESAPVQDDNPSTGKADWL